MADDVGSVAQETARLLDALLGTAPIDAAASSTGHDGRHRADDGACPTCGQVPGATHTGSARPSATSPAPVCHLCPVCQLLRVVRSVRPETLDRLADLAAAVTETLRDAAASRWAETESSPRPPSRPHVEDIPVADGPGGDEAEAP
jgi:hypothetical protein